MFARGARVLLVGLLMVSIGLHLTLLQAAGWVGMLVKYYQTTASISEACAMTFDGQHPCRICTLVKAGKQTEQNQEASPTVKKLELFAASPVLEFVSPPREMTLAPAPSESAPSRSSRPWVPPPRTV